MNEKDFEQLDALPVQAAWLGVPRPERPEVDMRAVDGTALKLGGADFNILHTPGHTQGSLCIWIPQENKLVSGDTLFRETIGRTDLPGGDGRKILSSIKAKLFDLPEDAVVIPGHGETTTIGHEKEFNPFFQDL